MITWYFPRHWTQMRIALWGGQYYWTIYPCDIKQAPNGQYYVGEEL